METSSEILFNLSYRKSYDKQNKINDIELRIGLTFYEQELSLWSSNNALNFLHFITVPYLRHASHILVNLISCRP